MMRLSLVGTVLLLVVTLCTASAQEASDHGAALHAPSFDDMTQLREVSELAISPDGRWAAYVMTARFHPDVSGPGHIMLLDLHEHRTRTVEVSGPPHHLEWAARGEVLAFLAPSRGRTRIWRYAPRDSGTAPQLVSVSDSLGGDILAFTWNPSGTAIAYLASERGAPGFGASPRVAARPRLVLFRDSSGDYTGPTSPLYARDSAGVYVAVVGGGGGSARVVARHVISAKYGERVAWSHTGKLLVSGVAMDVSYLSQISSGLLYVIDPNTRAVHQVKPESQARKDPVWSPSGRRIADLKFEFLPEGGLLPYRYTLQVDDPGQSSAGTAFTRETDGMASISLPMWGGDDRTLYVARYQQATARLFAIDIASGRWRPLTPDTLNITHYAISRDGTTLLGVLENANQPQEIFRIDPVTGALTRLTHNVDMLPAMRLGHVDQLTWQSSDGRFTIHGFLIKPPSYDSTRRYPLIVLVHGGPGYPFTNSFVDVNFEPIYIPPQLLASEGFLVLLSNPRGDPSYGDAFFEGLHDDWGPGPFGDINAGISTLIARGVVDSNAVGIGGASYGGYLTAYAITQTHRFGAASIDDGPTDLISEYGQNYATHAAWAQATFDGPPWTRHDVYASQSPITYVSRVRTPVLMRYGGRSSTGDHVRQSYFLAQGFEFYAGLRDMGVPVEFVLHPDQGHGITDWELYKDWIVRNLRWFDYWLLHRGTNPLADAR